MAGKTRREVGALGLVGAFHMRSHLLFWLILFGLGALVGDRYGLPSLLTNLTDKGFERIEGMIGGGVSSDEEENELDASSDELAARSEESAPAVAAAPASSDLGHPDNANLRINDAGLQIIKDSEGLRLEAYNLGGQWLIGYGHSGTARAGMIITEAEAEQLLRQDVRDAEDGVRRRVLVPVNQNQFSAMVSLAYNLGVGGFGGSSVLEALNEGDYSEAADNFLNHNRAGGVPNEHLTHRREQERALFLTPA